MSVETIAEREADLRRAMLAADVHALDRLLDDALVFTTHLGALVSKAGDIEGYRSGLLRLTRLEPADEEIRLYGNVAVVTVGVTLAGTYAGATFTGPFRFTRVWYKRAEGWRVVAAHVSEVVG
jgi:ketosteroid isomerase-like protein